MRSSFVSVERRRRSVAIIGLCRRNCRQLRRRVAPARYWAGRHASGLYSPRARGSDLGAPGPHRKRGSIRGRVFSAGKTQRRKKCTFLHVAHSIPPLHFFPLFFELFREMVPVQLPRPLRAAAAAAVRPRQVRALSSPAPRRAIGGGAGRATPAAPEVGRRRRQSGMIVKAAAALSPSDPDAPPPYELEDYTP